MKVKKKDSNTEKAILEAAEQVFMDKGYALAKTTDIAKIAGVNHAMLHYYFRSKANLFNIVFEQKAQLLADSFVVILDQDLPFLDRLKLSIERHFDLLAAHPKLPLFIFNEIMASEEKREMVQRIMLPKVKQIVTKMQQAIDQEAAKGIISPANSMDVILNIVSQNVFTFIASQFILNINDKNESEEFLKHRKDVIVRLILKGLM